MGGACSLDFKGMIDYIFATPQSLARLGVLGPLDTAWLQSNKIIGFPHPHVPSDHIPIMAHFAIIPTSHQRPPQQQAHTANYNAHFAGGGGHHHQHSSITGGTASHFLASGAFGAVGPAR
jgi:CCR4-NOT transcription complex subunit 6